MCSTVNAGHHRDRPRPMSSIDLPFFTLAKRAYWNLIQFMYNHSKHETVIRFCFNGSSDERRLCMKSYEMWDPPS